MDLIITILPVVTKDLPISSRFTAYDFFLSRCKFSTLTTRQPMVEFYLLTFPRFPLRKKEHKSYLGKNRTHDFRTSRCAGYLLDHSGLQISFVRELMWRTPTEFPNVAYIPGRSVVITSEASYESTTMQKRVHKKSSAVADRGASAEHILVTKTPKI